MGTTTRGPMYRSWQRFCEPGRQVGYLSPAFVARSRRVGGAMPAARLDAVVERGTCVPPGYCLVDCVGALELSVVAC